MLIYNVVKSAREIVDDQKYGDMEIRDIRSFKSNEEAKAWLLADVMKEDKNYENGEFEYEDLECAFEAYGFGFATCISISTLLLMMQWQIRVTELTE